MDLNGRNVTKHTLSREVADVLSLPYCGKKGKAYDIVTAMFTSIREALLRGEEVRISGFGIFHTRTRPPTRKNRYYFPWLGLKGLHSDTILLPEKRYVHFTPAKPLMRMIQHPTSLNPEIDESLSK